MYHFDPPRTCSGCKDVTLRDATDERFLDPKEIFTKLHVNWGHVSARRLKRVLADSGGVTMGLANCADEALGQCEMSCDFDEAPHISIAGASAVPTLNEKFQARPSFSYDKIAWRALGVFSEYSLLAPVPSTNPRGGRAIFERPERVQMNGGGEWEMSLARRVAWRPSFRERARAIGSSKEEMGSRVGFLGRWSRMIVSEQADSLRASVLPEFSPCW